MLNEIARYFLPKRTMNQQFGFSVSGEVRDLHWHNEEEEVGNVKGFCPEPNLNLQYEQCFRKDNERSTCQLSIHQLYVNQQQCS